ncbi:MAG: glycoside hydrolase family 3 N-terminal domain-containing protein [Acidimicrobiales bacterium]
MFLFIAAALVAFVAGLLLWSGRTADDEPATTGSVPTTSPASTSTSTSSATTTTSTTTTTISPVEEALAEMTVEQKAGQVLVSQFSGQPDEAVFDLLRSGAVGSVFVTGRSGNLTDQQGTTAMIASLQAAAADNGAGLLVATDQEGGRVQQVDIEGVTPFPPADRYGQIAETAGLVEAENLTRAAHQVMGTELNALGFNVDFAPVADVNVVGNQGAIGNRSFSADPATAAALTAVAVEGLDTGGVAATAKHFPGHGSTSVDSHRQLPVVDETTDVWARSDALPFEAAIEVDTPLVMIGHLFYPALDPVPEPRPASLSPAIITDLLRGELGFEGVVVTDDLAAMAPVATLPIDTLVVDALNAGVDLLLTPADVVAAHGAIVAAVADGRVAPETLDAAVARVLTLKQQLGVLDPDSPPSPPPPEVDAGLVRLVLSNACTAAGTTC